MKNWEVLLTENSLTISGTDKHIHAIAELIDDMREAGALENISRVNIRRFSLSNDIALRLKISGGANFREASICQPPLQTIPAGIEV